MSGAAGAKPDDVNTSATEDDDDAQAQELLDDAVNGADDEDQDDEQDKDKLGDAGKQALDRMKAQRNAARDELRKFKAAGLTPAQIDELAKPKGDDQDKPDAEQLRREAETAANARVNSKLKRSAVIAAAAGKFANPKLAPRLLDLDQFEVDGNGDVDEDEIAEVIDEYLEKEPYLKAAQGRKFGDADAGPRGGSRPKQITEAELERMSPAEVVEARKAGRLDHLLKKT